MKRLFVFVTLLFAMLFAAPGWADEAPAVAAAVTATADTVATAAPAAAPVPNKGDTAWLITATLLVVMMATPGLGLFYGGMVRSKNMLSVLMQTLVVFCLLGVLWAVYGYSLAFTDGNAFFGGFDKLFMKGVTPETVVATFSKGVVLPEYLFAAFELTFAAITPALIIGGFAERIKFSAMLIFMVLWFTFSYIPMAHMVWYWAGPDAFTSAEAAAKAGEFAGFLFNKGALDFAGGTVVHINAGVAALVGAFMIGPRIGYRRESMAPHSLTMTMVGASLLFVGWFWLQRRLGAGSRCYRRPGLLQHAGGHLCGNGRLDGDRGPVQGQAVHAGCRFRRHRRPGGDHPGLRSGRTDGRHHHGLPRRHRVLLGRQ